MLGGLLLTACQQPDMTQWHRLDLEKDGLFGTSSERAYQELLAGKTGQPVVVAVLDNGFDTAHETLRRSLWVNEGEIPDNGIDDDGNGYVDDVHGWNFAGDKDSAYHYDNYDLTLMVRQERMLGQNSVAHQALEAELRKERQEAREKLEQARKMKSTLDAIVARLGTDDPTIEDFRSFQPKNAVENQIRSRLNANLKRMGYADFYRDFIEKEIEKQVDALHYGYNLDYMPNRDIRVSGGDTTYWPGNTNLFGKDGEHGTHVAGIVANDSVHVMVVRLGYLGIRDEDIARGIRYAVDNGAKVISMSFGKEKRSLNPTIVDAGVQYAMDHDVLLVQAVGNSDEDRDGENGVYYPSARYSNRGKAAAQWISVGASGQYDDETLKASFSNYGKTSVDVFAPGVSIYSATPGNAYAKHDGTSMAAPVVAGLAGLIRSHYPELSAIQVKEIIMNSVTKSDRLAERCVSGGVVNTYNALKLAEQMKNTDE